MKYITASFFLIFLVSCKCKFMDMNMNVTILSNVDSLTPLANYPIKIKYFSGRTQELGGCSSYEQSEFARTNSQGKIVTTLRQVLDKENQNVTLSDSIGSTFYEGALKVDLGIVYAMP